MAVVSYTVRCCFSGEDPGVAARWVEWLRDSHIAEVMAHGASGAEIVRMNGEPETFEIRYRFPDREVFEKYIREHAPDLRADGLRRFPLELGLEYSRSDGDIVYSSLH
jgi:Domain of unknown function (DUF4286)